MSILIGYHRLSYRCKICKWTRYGIWSRKVLQNIVNKLNDAVKKFGLWRFNVKKTKAVVVSTRVEMVED